MQAKTRLLASSWSEQVIADGTSSPLPLPTHVGIRRWRERVRVRGWPKQMIIVTCALLALGMLTHPTHAEGEKESITPLPSLNTVEECQRADLQRYLGKTFRFHHGACWADVSIDENGKITSFVPEDEAACREALKEECGWVD